MSKLPSLFNFFLRVSSGGQFNTINSNFEYREQFKKSLRQYNKSTTAARAVRPVFSAVSGNRNIVNKNDSRFLRDIKKAGDQVKEDNKLRMSLTVDNKKEQAGKQAPEPVFKTNKAAPASKTLVIEKDLS